MSLTRNKSKYVLLVALTMGVSLAAAQSGRAGDIRVLQAVKRVDVAAVRTLIRERADVNGAEGDGSTPLLWASYRSNLEIARALIAAGADVNAANRLRMTPLLQASRLGDGPMVELLLKAGATATTIYPEGETALMAAAGSGSLQAVRLLLGAGVDPNSREQAQGQSALMWAAHEGHVQVVQALLEAGADVNAMARPSTLSRLRGDGGRMWVDWSSGGLTPVMFAARQGNLDVVRVLADRGAALSLANPDGVTAMIMAILNDRIDVAALLIEKGANPNDGSLQEAVRLHNIRTNETAGEATRPRPNNPNTLSPLDLIARLIDAGADPYRAATHTLHLDGTGQPAAVNETAMARALASQDVAAVRIMLSKGANANAAGPDGATPLLTALGGGAGGRGGFAGGFGAQPAGFRFQADRTPVEVVRTLIAAGADVNAARPTGDTALHAAAQSGNVAMIQLLADSGARLDVQNKNGFTALDVALGRQAPPGAAAPAAGAARGGGGGGGARGGGAPQPQPQAIALLRQLMGLPAEAPAVAPGPTPDGAGQGRGGNQ